MAHPLPASYPQCPGNFKGEPVYSRISAKSLRSAEGWLKLARVVRDCEVPLCHQPTTGKSDRGEAIDDSLEENPSKLFGMCTSGDVLHHTSIADGSQVSGKPGPTHCQLQSGASYHEIRYAMMTPATWL